MIRRSLKFKLILYTYLFVVPIITLVSAFIFVKDYNSSKQKTTEECLRDLSDLSSSVEDIKNNMKTYGTYITINEEIQNILDADNTDSLNKSSTLWYSEAPMKVLEDMIALDSSIKTMAIYPENKIKPYLRCFDESSYLSKEKIISTVEYISALTKKGTYAFTRADVSQNSFYESIRTPKLVLFREIYDMSRKKPLGYLCIGSNADVLDDMCKGLVVSEEDAICVYGIKEKKLLSLEGNTESYDEYIKPSLESGIIPSPVTDLNDKLLFSDVTEDLIVAKVVSKADFYDSPGKVVAAPLTLLLGIIIGLIPVLLIITNSILKPIKDLSDGMDEFKEGNLDLTLPIKDKDEIGSLTETFNGMVQGMKDLINKNYILTLKEKESEIAALSAQINPHFLYNTLDSLYWRVLDAGNEEIAEDIMALSDLFRLVLGHGERFVTVSGECDMLKHYLHIQKMRFGENLHYEFNIEKEVESVTIPRLILQPFVENAIVHGFEKEQGDFKLEVSARIISGKASFEITDNGRGITEEELNSLFIEDSKSYRAERVGHFAIKNIKERLEILYKDEYDLKILSEIHRGTTVRLTIPITDPAN